VPVAPIAKHLDRADRVETNRHDYADALPAVMDREGTTIGWRNLMGAGAARKYRFPVTARGIKAVAGDASVVVVLTLANEVIGAMGAVARRAADC
jgi:hypothetical protein